mmetsp:Transcript_55031/g.159333  ORF Transcript_55031/g.159333 Transcript_55031/m.159333 type:complete len:1124 (+) Transcript_55031:53-3424(+)
MPLPLLAAVAAPAATLWNYNRANFLYDSGQKVTRTYTSISYKMQQFQLYRQDIRDLVALTTEKMANYHVVACLELGMTATLLGPARLPEDVPEWILWHQLVSLCSAFVFLVTSMWLATRAAVAAGSFNVRLQTQYIRLPLPDDEQLDSALTKAEEFEGVDIANILRLPFLTGLWNKFWGNKIAGQEGIGLLRGGSGTCEGQPGGPKGVAGVGASPQGTRHAADHVIMDPQGPGHLQLYQHLQRKWSCYDAYARITMSMGTFWLALSLAYYEVGWNISHLNKVFPAVVAAVMLAAIVVLLIYLDIFLSRLELLGASLLVFAGPVIVVLGAAVGPREVDSTPFYAVAADIVHVVLSLWLFYLGRIVPGKEILPARWKAVAYLDIFGPIVKELKALLDQSGLGHHAQAEDDFIDGDFSDLFDFVDKDKSGTITREEWEEAFDAIDTNHSGTISREEWRQHHGKACIFDVVDGNGNGAVSRAEWRAAFAAFDRNGDGTISYSEWRRDITEVPDQSDIGSPRDASTDEEQMQVGTRRKNARSRLQAAIENVSGSTRRQSRALTTALQIASLVGIRPDDPQVQEAEVVLAQLEAPRELKRLRKIVEDWRCGEVYHHLSPSQRGELSSWLQKLSGALQRFGVVTTGLCHRACPPPPVPTTAEKPRPVVACLPIGKPAAPEDNPLPTILRSISVNSSASSEYVPVWTKVTHCPTENGEQVAEMQPYDYWVGTATEEGHWGFGDEVPKDARHLEFDALREQCEQALRSTDKALAPRGGLRGAAAGDRAMQRQESMTSALMLEDGDIDDDDPVDSGPERHKSKLRHGHHPVVAFRVMSLFLVGVWSLGGLVHFVRFVEEQVSISSRRLTPMIVEEAGVQALLRGTASAPGYRAVYAWPEQFFEPQSARCQSGSSGLVVSNGFLVYRLPSGACHEGGGGCAQAAEALLCPVEEHRGLVSVDCAGERCTAVVAADSGLWRCGDVAGGARPIAVVAPAYLRGRRPLEVWAALDAQFSTVFAAARNGPIVELRREGSTLRPVAELAQPSELPRESRWELLAVLEAPQGGFLVGVAGPVPMLSMWSLATGQHLGVWHMSASDQRWLGWCVSDGSELHGLAPSLAEGDVEMRRFAIPSV